MLYHLGSLSWPPCYINHSWLLLPKCCLYHPNIVRELPLICFPQKTELLKGRAGPDLCTLLPKHRTWWTAGTQCLLMDEWLRVRTDVPSCFLLGHSSWAPRKRIWRQSKSSFCSGSCQEDQTTDFSLREKMIVCNYPAQGWLVISPVFTGCVVSTPVPKALETHLSHILHIDH